MKVDAMPLTLKPETDSVDKVKDAKLHKACQGFEAIMLKQLLTTMRKSVPKGGLFKTGYAEDMYNSMHDEQLAKSLSSGKGMGIADMMYKQVSGEIKQHADNRQYIHDHLRTNTARGNKI
jgi:flagellar protein FlgJ